ncbi:glycosyltransferase [Sphaerisporangium sp. NPDC049002]|uniref:glycosyltransferase n=1 Tax=unclassified Sphaerisporangium TaxID=2630420 RepID=UPI0033C3A687
MLFAWRRIPPPFLIGGAEVSQQVLAEQFAAAGWRTLYLASHEPPWATTSMLPAILGHLNRSAIAYDYQAGNRELHYLSNGVRIRVVAQNVLIKVLDTTLREERPDLVITSQEGSAELAAHARTKTKVLGWLHSVSNTGMHVLDGRPHCALATSQFVLSQTPSTHAAVLFYPPFRPPDEPSGSPDADLLMINPVPAKGAKLMHQLAELLPHRRFTLVEGWWDTAAEFACHPNVTYLPRTYDPHDMTALYRRHRLLLVPSVVDDAFPRVIIEAALAGLPAIGSAKGGIGEAIGDPTLLAPPDQHAAWIALIRTLTQDRLAELADQAGRRAIPLTRCRLPELAAAGIIGT